MLISLRNLNVSCLHVPFLFCCMAYADDVILLAHSLIALRLMLNLCSQFAATNNLLFNPNSLSLIVLNFVNVPM